MRRSLLPLSGRHLYFYFVMIRPFVAISYKSLAKNRIFVWPMSSFVWKTIHHQFGTLWLKREKETFGLATVKVYENVARSSNKYTFQLVQAQLPWSNKCGFTTPSNRKEISNFRTRSDPCSHTNWDRTSCCRLPSRTNLAIHAKSISESRSADPICKWYFHLSKYLTLMTFDSGVMFRVSSSSLYFYTPGRIDTPMVLQILLQTTIESTDEFRIFKKRIPSWPKSQFIAISFHHHFFTIKNTWSTYLQVILSAKHNDLIGFSTSLKMKILCDQTHIGTGDSHMGHSPTWSQNRPKEVRHTRPLVCIKELRFWFGLGHWTVGFWRWNVIIFLVLFFFCSRHVFFC